MNRKNTITLLSAIFFLALAFYAMLAFIDNIDIAYQWHYDVIKKVVTATVDEKGKIVEKVYTGPFPFVDWTCVDMSVVSTLCPFLGFLLIGIGFIRILAFKKDGEVASESFPFFYDYDRIMVILGLAGTLWGIIMIGFYRTEEVTMPKLMICLHTSLYSTLVVILWIFLFSRPIGKIMRWWYGNITGREIRAEADISVLFRELGTAVSGAARDFKEAGVEAFEFKKQTEKAKEEFKGVATFLEEFKKQTGLDVFGAVKGLFADLTLSCQNISQILLTMQSESKANKQIIEKQEKVIEKQQEFLNQLNKKLADEMRLRQEADQKATLAEKEKEKAVSWILQIRTFLKGLK